MGGTGNDYVKGLKLTEIGHILLTGYTSSSFSIDGKSISGTGSALGFLAALNGTGYALFVEVGLTGLGPCGVGLEACRSSTR